MKIKSKFSEHIKLAGFIGLVAGVIFGTIDAIARIAVMSFEWYELYQTFLIHTLLLTLVFVVMVVFLELIMKITGLKISKEGLSIFYLAGAISLFLVFYLSVFVAHYVITTKPFSWNSERVTACLIVVLLAGLNYIFLLTKGKRLVSGVLSFVRKDKIKMLAKNYAFIIVVFVVIAFSSDFYLFHDIPVSATNNELEGYPNILLITMDTVRADHLSLYGYALNTTPNIDKLAEDSVVFDNAISVTSWTLPTHASIFTGRYPSNHGATHIYQYLDDTETTMAEILREKGYNTVGFVGGAYSKAKYGIGQGFITYKDRLDLFETFATFDRFSLRNIIHFISPKFHDYIFNVDAERTSEELNNDIFIWLDKNKGQPFFMFINYFDAHTRYDLGTEFREQFTDSQMAWNEMRVIMVNENVSEEDISTIISFYDTEILYLDYHMGKLFEKLDEDGIKDNTVIIITADHGEEFYEHGGFEHSATLYEEVIHVPLIIYYPEKFQPQRIEQRVGNIHIFSTVLELLGIDEPENVNIDSISLLPLIENGSYGRQYVLSELFGPEWEDINQTAFSIGEWKLIEVTINRNEEVFSGLFNLETDPDEQANLYDDENYTEIKNKLVGEMIKVSE